MFVCFDNISGFNRTLVVHSLAHSFPDFVGQTQRGQEGVDPVISEGDLLTEREHRQKLELNVSGTRVEHVLVKCSSVAICWLQFYRLV